MMGSLLRKQCFLDDISPQLEDKMLRGIVLFAGNMVGMARGSDTHLLLQICDATLNVLRLSHVEHASSLVPRHNYMIDEINLQIICLRTKAGSAICLHYLSRC